MEQRLVVRPVRESTSAGRRAVAGLVVLALSAACTQDPQTARRSPSQASASPRPSAGAASPSPTAVLGTGRATCARGPELSFTATDTGREQIYLLRASRVTQVVRLPGFVSDPAWSPNGRRVAFRWFRPSRPAPDVYMANADGTHLMLLVRQAAMPAWSPDGRVIAFANLRAGDRGISTVDVAQALRGQGRVRIVTRTSDDVPEERPFWSPDGDQITFTSHRAGTSDIWIVGVDGSGLRNLTAEDYSLDTNSTWSPDGERIAFGSDRNSSSQFGGDIYVMRTDGSDVRQITFDDSAYAPAWSPDGCGIAFNSGVSGTSQIYVMESDGSNIRQLTTAHPDARGKPTIACCAAWRLGELGAAMTSFGISSIVPSLTR